MPQGSASQTEELLNLIQIKNRCLERLMASTETLLLISTEALMEDMTDASPLQVYDRERAATLKALELYDRKISETIPRLTAAERNAPFLAAVKTEMLKNEQLLASIFNADDIVFAKIREAQARISRTLQDNRKSRDLLAKFKSTWVAESGDEMDKTL